MSYTILYKSMFIKTKEGFIPMIQLGDNNVWECGSHKRSRNWECWNFKGYKKVYTHDEIVSFLEEWNNSYKQKLAKDLASDDEYDRRGGSFGYYLALSVYGKHTTTTTFNVVKNLILSGEECAVSLEFAIKNLGLHFTYWEKEEGKEFSSRYTISPKSEEEFWQILNDKFDNGEKECFLLYSRYSADRTYDYQKALSALLSRRTGRKPRWRTSNNEFIVICSKRNEDNMKYYVTIKDGELHLTENIKEAHVFNKQKAGGKETSDIIWNFIPDIRALKFEYNFYELLAA